MAFEFLDVFNWDKDRRDRDAAEQSAKDKAIAGDVDISEQQTRGDLFGAGSEKFNVYNVKQAPFLDPGYNKMADSANAAANAAAAKGRGGVQVHALSGRGATIDQNAANGARGLETALGSQLLAASQGQGPSAAQAQLTKGIDAAVAQQLGLAASSRGNPAIALRNAAANTAQITQGAATDSAILRANEIQNAQGQLGALSTSIRGQDIGLASQQASLDQQMAMQNTQNAQQSEILSQQMGQQKEQFYAQLEAQYRATGMNAEQARIAAAQDYQKFSASLLAQQQAAKSGLNSAAAAQGGQVIGAIGSAIGAGAMKAAGVG